MTGQSCSARPSDVTDTMRPIVSAVVGLTTDRTLSAPVREVRRLLAFQDAVKMPRAMDDPRRRSVCAISSGLSAGVLDPISLPGMTQAHEQVSVESAAIVMHLRSE